MQKIDKTMTIHDILDIKRELAIVFFQAGMYCLGCPSAENETLEEACQVHGIDADDLCAKLNAALREEA